MGHLCRVQALPLQLVLIVPFVLQIFGAVGLVGYLSFKNGQRTVNELVVNLERQVNKQIDQHLDNYLSNIRRLNELNAEVISSGLIDPQDLDALGTFFWQQAKLYNVGYILFGTNAGQYVDVGRPLTYPVELITERLDPKRYGDTRLYIYEPDEQGRRGKLIDTDPNYLFQKERWFSEVIQTGKPLWTEVYTWQSLTAPLAISISSPVYDQNKNVIGAIAVEQRLSQISDFLERLDISRFGQVLILERNGLLIANSGPTPPFAQVNREIQRLPAIASPNLMVRELAHQLQQRFPDLKTIHHPQELKLTMQGEQQYVRVTPWRDQYGLDWLVVVSVPETIFMAQIHANNRTTILLCIGALAIATLLGIFTTRWIARPILRLNRASQAMSSGNLDQIVEDSVIQELNILAMSFNRMAEQLQESFTALASNNEALEDRVEARTVELRNTLSELQRTQAWMLQSEKMSSLGQLVAGIAHEINNPINFIYANLVYVERYAKDLLNVVHLYQRHYPQSAPEIMAEVESIDLEFLHEDLPKILASMQMGSDRIRQIVLSLRNFSRMDESEIKRVNLHEGLDSTLLILQHRFKAQADRPEIQIIKHYGDLPKVECYAGQLNQVLMNILTNAIDALEEKAESVETEVQSKRQSPVRDFTPTIWINTEVVDLEWASVAIADNGVGMTEAVRQHVFDPFFTTKPTGQGTGMGLAISYQIITDKHGGFLDCESTLGQGTKFTIRIPIHDDEPDPDPDVMYDEGC